jgi:ribosome-binding factor A
MANYKIARIESDISRYISDILMNETRDSLLKTITVTACKVTHDLGFCKVYFTSLNNDLTPSQLEKELNEAAPFVRGKLSEKIDIRHTPEIKFIYDESIAYGEKIESILKNIN